VPVFFRSRRLLVVLCFACFALPVIAQSLNPQATDDPLRRPAPAAKKGRAHKEKDYYKKWLEEDVPYIITDEERRAFKKLSTDAEREQFVEIFWRHRDPTPDTEENEYKDEYYRRIIYANEHFSAGMAGSKTDRGRMYILHGAPDSIERHPAGGPYLRTAEEGGGQTVTYPFEIWRYRNVSHVGQEIEIEFVDSCGCGEYSETLDRGRKDAFQHIPGIGLTDQESMHMSSKADRSRDIETLGPSFFDNNRESKEFERMAQSVAMNAPPPLPDIDAATGVSHIFRPVFLPFDVRVDYVKATGGSVLAPITLQVANRELSYVNKDGIQRASVNVYGRVSTITGRVLQTFEDPLRLDIPADLLEKFKDNVSLYQQILPLRPGHYRLDIVVKDVNGDKLGTYGQSIVVPDFSGDDRLSSSTLVLADLIEPVSFHSAGPGSFVLGAERVRPRVAPSKGGPVVFASGQKVKLWMQVYNLVPNGPEGRSSATAEYQVTDAAGKEVFSFTKAVSAIGNQGTLEETLPPEKLTPGVYRLTVRVRDLVANKSIAPSAMFVIQ